MSVFTFLCRAVSTLVVVVDAYKSLISKFWTLVMCAVAKEFNQSQIYPSDKRDKFNTPSTWPIRILENILL